MEIVVYTLHFIFFVNERKPVLRPLLPEFPVVIEKTLQGQRCGLIKVGGWDNHLHVLFKMTQHKSIDQVAQKLMTDSADWVKRQGECYQDFAWDPDYSYMSVGYESIRRVSSMIERQDLRHKKITVEEELTELAEGE